VQTRVKRVVYPRGDTVHDAWLSVVNFVPRAAPLEQLLGSVAMPVRRRGLSLYAHSWLDDLGWLTENLPAAGPTYDESFFPAIDQLAQSFRARRFPLTLHHRVGAARETFAPTLSRPAIDQQMGSYRMRERARLGLLHAWLDTHAWIQENLPAVVFDAVWSAAFAHQLAAFRLADPRRRSRGLDLLWNSHSRSTAAWEEDVTIWGPAFAQQAAAFRMDAPPRLDLFRHVEWIPQQGWFTFATFDHTLWGGIGDQQQRASFLVGRRRRYDVRTADDAQQGWIAPFSPALVVALAAQQLGGFLPARRGRYDVRTADAAQDGWLDTASVFDAALIAAFAQALESYRMADARDTLPLWPQQWQDPMAWLKAPLDLAEPRRSTQRRLLTLGVGR
jgi:hypothetical protein